MLGCPYDMTIRTTDGIIEVDLNNIYSFHQQHINDLYKKCPGQTKMFTKILRGIISKELDKLIEIMNYELTVIEEVNPNSEHLQEHLRDILPDPSVKEAEWSKQKINSLRRSNLEDDTGNPKSEDSAYHDEEIERGEECDDYFESKVTDSSGDHGEFDDEDFFQVTLKKSRKRRFMATILEGYPRLFNSSFVWVQQQSGIR